MEAILVYEHTDIPPGLTIAEYRRSRNLAAHRHATRVEKLRRAVSRRLWRIV